MTMISAQQHTIPRYISFSALELLGIAFVFAVVKVVKVYDGVQCVPVMCVLPYLWVNCFGFALKFGGLNAVGVKHPFSISVYLLKFQRRMLSVRAAAKPFCSIKLEMEIEIEFN